MNLGVNKAFELLAGKLQGWINAAIKLIPNLIAAILILLVFFGIGWLIRKIVKRSLKRVTSNKAVVSLIETITGIAVVAIGAFIALGVLQLSGAVTTLLAGAGVIGLALGFAFQDIAANLMSGIILSFRHPFGIDDMIKTNDYYGYVHKINLRCTIVRTTQGQLVYIPNKDVLNSPFINYTWNGERRIDLTVGCSYGDDLDEVEEIAIKTIEEHVNTIEGKPIQVVFKELSGSTINFDIRFWVPFKVNYDLKKPKSHAVKAINKTFHEHDIGMPFPVRTLDFDIRDGMRLHESLNQVKWNDNGDGE